MLVTAGFRLVFSKIMWSKLLCTTANPFPWWPGHPGVILSRSTDVFTNLALEDWIYQRCDWTTTSSSSFMTTPPPLLMLWRNSPCVVVGRHQNPWLEVARLDGLPDRGVNLARRNSGGGTVYHDLGNLNCTFFSSREAYNRRHNLEFICEAIDNMWPGVDVTVSDREDILLDSFYKISGTAAKLGRTSAYHHCTILCEVDKSSLSNLLSSETPEGFESKATRSVKSWVKNLKDAKHTITCNAMEHLLGSHFLDKYNFHGASVTPVEPSEEVFPGLTEIRSKFRSWDWIFGKCPQFTIEMRSTVPTAPQQSSLHDDVVIRLKVQHGLIHDILVTPDHWMRTATRNQINNIFVGKKFPHKMCQLNEFFCASTDDEVDHEVQLQTSFLHVTIVNSMKNVL